MYATHPRICYQARCLHMDNALDELDAAHFDARRRCVHPFEDIGLYGCHLLPRSLVASIVDAEKTGK